MKILAIRGCNLASLAGEFEIDLANGPLSAAGVFAIVGPTGAGKSTLLDAMCVALFDRTPRLTNHSRVVVGRGDDDPTALGALDVRSLLRRGAAAGYAEVDFESGDLRRYRARWSVRRARNATDGRFQSQQLTLAAIDAGGHTVEQLGGTKTETLDAIHQRLGLSFDQFRRSALLAQGEFAAFLKAEGKDRSELLERMTGTEIYSRLSVAAHQRAALAEQQLRERHGAALAIAVLSDDDRTRAEQDLALAKQAQVAARDRLAAAERAAHWLAEATRRERALSDADAQRLAAEAAVAASAPQHAELALRRRAEALRPPYDEVVRLERQLAFVQRDAVAATEAATAADLAHRTLDTQRALLAELYGPIRDARIAAALVERPAASSFGVRARAAGTMSSRSRSARGSTPDLRADEPARVELLATAQLESRARAAAADAAWLVARPDAGALVASWPELDARLAQRAALAAEIAAAETQLATRAKDRAALAARRTTAATDHQAATARLVEAQTDAASFEKRRGLTLDAARRAEDEARARLNDVEKLVSIAHEARGALTARTELDRQAQELSDAATRDVAERLAAERDRDEAATVRAERTRMLDELRKAAGYEHARAELVDGDPCPLCGATEHPWAHRGAFDTLIADAQSRLRDVTTRAEVALAALATLTARDAQRTKDLARLAATRKTTDESLAVCTRRWRDQLGALGELLLVDDPASDAAAHLAIERTEAARAKLEAARSARSQAEAVAKAAAEAVARVQARQADVEHHAQAVRQIDAMLAAADAAAERQRGELVGKLDRHADLIAEIEASLARWHDALAPDDAARAVVELALDALGVKERLSANALGGNDRGNDGGDAGGLEMHIEAAHVARAATTSPTRRSSARTASGTHVSVNDSRSLVGGRSERAPAMADSNIGEIQVGGATVESSIGEIQVGAATDNQVGAASVGSGGIAASDPGALRNAARGHGGAVRPAPATHVGVSVARSTGGAGSAVSRAGAGSAVPRAGAGVILVEPSRVNEGPVATSGAGAVDAHMGASSFGASRAGAADDHMAATDRRQRARAGLDASVAALLERCRRALAETARAWGAHAEIVAALDAELRGALDVIDAAVRDAERALTEAIARRDAAVARVAGADDELAAASEQLADAQIAAAFDADELRRLLADSPARIEQLAQHLDALDRAADRARTLVGERRRHVDDHTASSPFAVLAVESSAAGDPAARADEAAQRLRADAANLVDLAAAVSTADHHAAALAATLAADRDARARRAEALALHAAAEQAAEVDRVLGEVIGSHDGKLFRSFAQSLTLDSLLAVANSHLEELAPRYQLERVPKHDLELQVIDRDLGNEIRSVQSLSGGESFLVSLALALGLSSMSAHDVRVRTLLIDEGFGTLDPATLDGALAVLDALQATGRQVGVISHVPALVERVGAHVRVYPRGAGKSEVIVADA